MIHKISSFIVFLLFCLTFTMQGNRQELVAAIKSGTIAQVNKCISTGTDVNEKDDDGISPLMEACLGDFLEICKVLIGAGAIIDEENNAKQTALMIAAYHGLYEIVKELRRLGASITKTSSQGLSALGYAAVSGSIDVINFLLNEGAIIEHKDANGLTPLMIAAREGHEAAVDRLIKAGASIFARDNEGSTVLMFAAEKGQIEVARILIKAGASINATNQRLETALLVACIKENRDVGALLLEAGASVNVIDDIGLTPFLIGINHTDLLQLVLDYGAIFNFLQLQNRYVIEDLFLATKPSRAFYGVIFPSDNAAPAYLRLLKPHFAASNQDGCYHPIDTLYTLKIKIVGISCLLRVHSPSCALQIIGYAKQTTHSAKFIKRCTTYNPCL